MKPEVHHAHSLTFLLLSLSSFLPSCRDLGVHIDGFIANVAHSFVVGASKVKAVAELGGVGLAFYCCTFIFVCVSFRRSLSQVGKLMSSKRLICALKQLSASLNPVTRYIELFISFLVSIFLAAFFVENGLCQSSVSKP